MPSTNSSNPTIDPVSSVTPVRYSVVVPVLNEEGNVARLHAEICDTMGKIGEPYEILFVNDGSTDKTGEELMTLHPATIITFRKNTGQSAALDAGFHEARGRVIIALDGDGQNPPSEIPKLLDALTEDVDIVSGWRKHRKDSLGKRFLSRGADMLRGLLVSDGIHDSGCTLKAYRRECFEDLQLMGEMHRFIPAVLRIQGFRITEVVVEHRPRTAGKTKYNYRRVLKGFTDMISVWFWRKYAARPVHLFGGAGLVLGGFGVLLLIALGVWRLVYGHPLSTSVLPLIAVFAILLGFQFFASGILADILVKGYYSKDRMPYRIRSIKRQ